MMADVYLWRGLSMCFAFLLQRAGATNRYYGSYLPMGTGDNFIETYHLQGGSTDSLRKWNVECLDGEAVIGIRDDATKKRHGDSSGVEVYNLPARTIGHVLARDGMGRFFLWPALQENWHRSSSSIGFTVTWIFYAAGMFRTTFREEDGISTWRKLGSGSVDEMARKRLTLTVKHRMVNLLAFLFPIVFVLLFWWKMPPVTRQEVHACIAQGERLPCHFISRATYKPSPSTVHPSSVQRIQGLWCKYMFPYKPPTQKTYPYYSSCFSRNLTTQTFCYDPSDVLTRPNSFMTALYDNDNLFLIFRVPADNTNLYKCCVVPAGYYIDYLSCYYKMTHDQYYEYYDANFYLVFCDTGYVVTGLGKKLNPWINTEYNLDWIQCCRVGVGPSRIPVGGGHHHSMHSYGRTYRSLENAELDLNDSSLKNLTLNQL